MECLGTLPREGECLRNHPEQEIKGAADTLNKTLARGEFHWDMDTHVCPVLPMGNVPAS